MTLREIAERLNKRGKGPGGLVGIDAEEAFLLDAVVEERAKRRKAEFHTFHHADKSYCSDCLTLTKKDTRHDWADNDWLIQALNELNLKGVRLGEK